MMLGILASSSGGAPPPAGSVEFVGAGKLGVIGNATFTFDLTTLLLDEAGAPAVLQEGDFLLANYGTGTVADRSYTPPVDWTERVERYKNAATTDTSQVIFYMRAGATPPTSVTFPITNSSTDAGAVTVHAFRGVDATTPFDVADVLTDGEGTQPDPGSVTPASGGSMIVVAVTSGAATATAFTNPGDLNTTTNHFQATTSADTFDANVATGIKEGSAGVAFNGSAFTGGPVAAGDGWLATVMVLKPA